MDNNNNNKNYSTVKREKFKKHLKSYKTKISLLFFKQQDKNPYILRKLSCKSPSYVNLGFPHKKVITYGDMKHEWVIHGAKQQNYFIYDVTHPPFF